MDGGGTSNIIMTKLRRTTRGTLRVGRPWAMLAIPMYLTDRKHFMIISGGVNIYPQEAENALITHDAVVDAAVFGVPNPDFGEEVKGVVQLRDPAMGTPEMEVELLDYCRSQLSSIKCPRSIDFRDELPRHPTGKLYKRLLKDEYWTNQ